MARDDEGMDEEIVAEDSGAAMGNALIVLTGVMLLVAIYIVLHLLAKHYQAGMLA